MSSTRTAVLVRALVVGAVVLGTAGFVTANKSVTVAVDGGERQVRTFAATVGDLLHEQSVSVGEHDVVFPTTTAAVSDGTRVEVRRGRLVMVDIDGVQREIWTTAETVAELTDSLGSRYTAAALTVSRSTRIPVGGLAVGLSLPKDITIKHDGTTTTIETAAPTLAAALAEAGISVTTNDRLSTRLSLAPVDGMKVRLVRVTAERRSDVRLVPFRTIRQADSSLYRGDSRVVRAGQKGKQKIIFRVVFHDGDRVAKKKVAVDTVRKPKARVIRYGTKPRPTYAPRAGSGVDGLNWAALARCESSGNPRSVGGGGLYFGLYQFTLGTWRSVGGSGNPIDASPAEQTARAKALYRSRGSSPWPSCGRLLYS